MNSFFSRSSPASSGKDIQIKLSEKVFPGRNIYVSPDNFVHILMPLSSGDDISRDNTCKAGVALQIFWGKGVNFTQNPDYILNQLTSYLTTLENDIAVLRLYRQKCELIFHRITQVKHYIRTINTIINQYSSLLTCLDNSFPNYPEPIINRVLSRYSIPRSDRQINVYTMVLVPTVLDNVMRFYHSPIFKMTRSDPNNYHIIQGPFYRILQEFYSTLRINRRSESSSPKDRLISSIILSNQLPMEVDTLLQNIRGELINRRYCNEGNISIEQLKTFALELGYGDGDSDLMSLSCTTVDSTDQEFGLNHLLLRIFDGLNLTFEETVGINPFEKIIHITDSNKRKGDLLIATQFLLAEINIYLFKKQITQSKFCDILENPGNGYNRIRTALVSDIKHALENNLDVQDAVFNFFDNNSTTFGINGELNTEIRGEISKLFAGNYATVNVEFYGGAYTTQHLDEEMILDKEPTSGVVCFGYCDNICYAFTDFLQQGELRNLYLSHYHNTHLNVLTLPAALNVNHRYNISQFSCSFDALSNIVTSAILTKDIDKLQQLFFKVVDGEYVFQKLGREYFNQYRQTHSDLFSRLLISLDDQTTISAFNEVLQGQRSQLLLTQQMARSLYVAVQDRRELPPERALQYHSVEIIKLILEELAELGSSGNVYSNGYQEIVNFTVNAAQNLDFIVEAPEGAIAIIQRICDEYQDTIHLSMSMNAALYKYLTDSYGAEHVLIQEMNILDNNIPYDPMPHKFLRACELANIDVPPDKICYNNTLNDKPWRTNRSERPDSLKGGSGYIIKDINPDSYRQICLLTEQYSNRITLTEEMEAALYLTLNDIFPNVYSNIELQVTNSQILEATLTSLGIVFTKVVPNRINGLFTIQLSPGEQAKLKWITNQKTPNTFVLNNDERRYTQGYRLPTDIPFVVRQRNIENEDIDSERQTIECTPSMAYGLYVAIVDRMNLPVDRILKYTTLQDVQNILRDFGVLSRRDCNFCLGYEHIVGCIASGSRGGIINITGSPVGIAKIQEIAAIYQNSIHLSTVMAASIYKKVTEQFGEDSKEYRAMQLANNNTPGDPTPFKLLTSLKLIGIDIDADTSCYTNTLNDFAYKSDVNKDNLVPKKGGSGFIINKLSQELRQRIEFIVEEQAYRVRLTAYYIITMSDIAERIEEYRTMLSNINNEQKKAQFLLSIFGLQYRMVHNTSDILVVEMPSVEESKLKILLRDRSVDIYGAPPDPEYLLINQEDIQRAGSYKYREEVLIHRGNDIDTIISSNVSRVKASN